MNLNFDNEYLLINHLQRKKTVERLIHGHILSHLKIYLALFSSSHGL